jgi:radical SAM-linked protein
VGGAPGAETPAKGTVRVRLLFSKKGNMRFLGHLDLVSVVKRMIRRSALPVVYSQGFHPMPKLVFSPPLPLGLESEAELLDIDMDLGTDPDTGDASLTPALVMERLNSVAPEGIRFLEAASISLNSSAPSASMGEVEYTILLKDGPKGLDIDLEKIDGILRDFQTKDSFLLRIFKKDKVREVDIRPLVSELRLDGDGDGVGKLRLVLKKADGPVLRPIDVLVGLLNLSAEDASLIPILKTKTAH